MRKLILTMAALAALTASAAAGDMTCRGEYSVHSNGMVGQEMRTLGSPEKRLCYLPNGDTEASAIVDAACKAGETCVVRAKVARRDTPNGMPQTYNILKVYSAKAK